MRLALVCTLTLLAACTPANVARTPPPPPEPTPEQVAIREAEERERLALAEARRVEAETRLAAARANEARRSQIQTASMGNRPLVIERPTSLRVSPSLLAEEVVQLEPGARVVAYTHDGRYWGVSSGLHWGYVNVDAAARDEDARLVVTTGRDRAAAEAERMRTAPAATPSTSTNRGARGAQPSRTSRPAARPARARAPAPSQARQCTATARSTGRRCLRRTTNASGRCWQH